MAWDWQVFCKETTSGEMVAGCLGPDVTMVGTKPLSVVSRKEGSWDATGHRLILPLFAWGYQRDVAVWYALLDRLESEALPVVNPVPVLRWNSDKAYLAELGAKGVAVVPTIEVAALGDAVLAAARAELDAEEVVIKPAISGGADGTHRIAAGAAVPADALGQRRLVQPLMPGILTEGEYSLFFFDGKFSHAIVKRPASGDFRVQEQFGGRESDWDASAEARALAAAALAAAPAPPVYARVDMVRGADGTLLLMELEVIEPYLYPKDGPQIGAMLGKALRRRIG